jgi:hypothetical protein
MQNRVDRFFALKKLFAVLSFMILLPAAALSARAQAEFRPPFKSSDTCQTTTQVGEGSVNYSSRTQTGEMSLAVRTTWAGQSFGRTGAGVTYTPNFSGPVRIKAFVNVNASSVDAAWALGPSVVALNSDVYVKLDGQSPAMFRFRSTTQNTLQYGLGDALKNFLSRYFPVIKWPSSALTFVKANTNVYNQTALYVAQLDTVATKNVPLRICGGVQSNALTANLLPYFSGVAAKYDAKLVKLTVERR